MTHEKKILWWIKIPSTDKVYVYAWEAGFTEYYKNEGILLTHAPLGGSDGIDWTGYIIGIHGSHKGKQTRAWAYDAEGLDVFID